MKDINVVVLVGRLTRDSELKYTNSGMAIARFSIAVNRSVKRGEEWEDEASFFDVDLWGKQAEGVNRYLLKGQQIALDGELRQDRWEQDGQNRSKVVITASNVRLMGSKPAEGGQAPAPRQEAPAAGHSAQPPLAAAPRATAPAQPPITAGDTFEDDIPFN